MEDIAGAEPQRLILSARLKITSVTHKTRAKFWEHRKPGDIIDFNIDILESVWGKHMVRMECNNEVRTDYIEFIRRNLCNFKFEQIS